MTTLFRWLAVLLLAALPVPVALAQEKDVLKELLEDNQNLQVQLQKAQKVQGDIAKAELKLQGADAARKHFEREIDQKIRGVMQGAEDIKTRSDQAGCPWGGSSTDKAFVEGCNETGRRLMAEMEQLKRQAAPLADMKKKVVEERDDISKRTIKLAAQKKSNNADLAMLEAERADWQRRYREFLFRSPTFERLKQMSPQSVNCAEVDSLVGAKLCLDQVWNASR